MATRFGSTQSTLGIRVWSIAREAIHLQKHPFIEQPLTVDYSSIPQRPSIEISTDCVCLYRGLTDYPVF